MTATRFILVRHGETEWNRKGVFRGRADVALNEMGRRQAAAAGRALSGLDIRRIYASPLLRAVETASLIGRRRPQARVLIEAGLNELDRGVWQGLTRAQAKRRYPAVYRTWYDHPEKAGFPEGETLRAVQRRAVEAFERIRFSCPQELAVIVSHNVVLRALLCGVLDIGLDRFQRFDLEPASISELVYEHGRLKVVRLNDRCHLASMRRSKDGQAARAD